MAQVSQPHQFWLDIPQEVEENMRVFQATEDALMVYQNSL
jgi:hypothetical protein